MKTESLPEVDLGNVIATLRTRLLTMIAALGTVAGELDTVEEVLRNPAQNRLNDSTAIESCLREALEAGTLLPDQTEELLTVLESMIDIVRADAGEGAP